MTRISPRAALVLMLAMAACTSPRGANPPLASGVPALRPCPDWSRTSREDFSNRTASNFGCADAVNFHAQLADPDDAVRGQGGSPGDAAGAAAAVERMRLPAAPPGSASQATAAAKPEPGT